VPGTAVLRSAHRWLLAQTKPATGMRVGGASVLRMAISNSSVAVGVVLGFVVQDRVDQRIFNRVVLGVIFLVGLSLVARAFGFCALPAYALGTVAPRPNPNFTPGHTKPRPAVWRRPSQR